MNIFKKVRNYILYKKIIKLHKKELKSKYKLEKDWIWRLYTVYSFSKDDIETIKKYGQSYIDGEVTKYIKNVDNYFRKIGLFEFVTIENVEVLNELEVGIIFTFKFLNPKKVFYFKLFSILLIIILITILVI